MAAQGKKPNISSSGRALPDLPLERRVQPSFSRESIQSDGHSSQHRLGSQTERYRNQEGTREAWELRRVIGENKKWRERCERLEHERDAARAEVAKLSGELVGFSERWHEREETIGELQSVIRELQAQLAAEVSASVSPATAASTVRQMVTSWSDSSGRPGTMLLREGGERALFDERFGSRLKGTLENRRTVAKRSQKFSSLETPALSLTPREASRASYESHLSERIAFQAGQVLKEQIKAHNRAEFLDTNLRMFGSVDLLVQVKLSEINVQLEGAPKPNVARLAVACDLFDKVTLTSEANYVGLNLLRDELFEAIFEGYTSSELAGLTKVAPSVRRARQLASFRKEGEKYGGATPYFVQVARLRDSLKTAQKELEDAMMQSGNKTRRQQLSRTAVTKLAMLHLSTLKAHCFYAWSGVCAAVNNEGRICEEMQANFRLRWVRYKALLSWFRAVIQDKSLTARRHVERESRKAGLYREALQRVGTAAAGRRDMNKDEIRHISNAWETFAVSAALELMSDTRRMVHEMCLEEVQDGRLLLRTSEMAVGSGMLDSLMKAPAEEVILRWVEFTIAAEHKVDNWGKSVEALGVFETILKMADGIRNSTSVLEEVEVDPKSPVARRASIAHPLPRSFPDLSPTRAEAATATAQRARRSSTSHLGGNLFSPQKLQKDIKISWENGMAGQGLLLLAQRAGIPQIQPDIEPFALGDSNDALTRLIFLSNIFLHVPNLKFSKAEALKEEFTALESAFSKLEEARALYIDGMDPVCKMVISFHTKIQKEHSDLVRAFAVYTAGKQKVQEFLDDLHKAKKWQASTHSAIPAAKDTRVSREVLPVAEVNAMIQLRLQRVLTVHSSKGAHDRSRDSGLLDSGRQRLVAFGYLSEVEEERLQTEGESSAFSSQFKSIIHTDASGSPARFLGAQTVPDF